MCFQKNLKVIEKYLYEQGIGKNTDIDFKNFCCTGREEIKWE